MDSIKEFIKYYIGCEVHSDQGTMTYRLWHISNDYRQILFKDRHGNEMWLPPEKWKLCLRKLSSITEEEKEQAFLSRGAGDGKGENNIAEAHEFHYLLSRGFWLFGDEAFDKGFIIEKQG